MQTENEQLFNYLIHLIKEEKYSITKQTEAVSLLANSLIEEIKQIKRSSKEITSDVISSPNSSRIQILLLDLFHIQDEINFRKQNIRNYKNKIFKINGFFNKDWE